MDHGKSANSAKGRNTNLIMGDDPILGFMGDSYCSVWNRVSLFACVDKRRELKTERYSNRTSSG
jgi:hypothetical protein